MNVNFLLGAKNIKYFKLPLRQFKSKLLRVNVDKFNLQITI